MRQRGTWSRRRLLHLMSLASILRTGSAAANDRGIGGTGVVASDGLNGDRGIGGTGVMGTIQRFSSIVVNDLRITFPRSVAVRIDDRRARMADLKLGHVVHILAREAGDHLDTRSIVASSEVVGPVEAVTPAALRVLGQMVVPGDGLGRAWRRWRPGDFVAVSGLRRHDGTIIASLIERRRPGRVRVAGTPRRDPDDTIRIGTQAIAGLDPALLDRRILVSGRLSGSTLVAETADVDLLSLMAQRPSRLSIEDYVIGNMRSLDLASGLPVADGTTLAGDADDERAFISARVEADGQIHIDSVRIVADPARTGGSVGHGEPWPANRPSPPGMRPGPPKGLGSGPAQSFNDGGRGPTGSGGGPGPNGPGGPSGPGAAGGPNGARRP